MRQDITVRVLKHDGSDYRRWNAHLRRRDHSLIVLDAAFDVDVSHQALGEISKGTRTVEYYWLDRWYNVFEFLEPDGRTRLWYCNINLPPNFDGDVLTYVDLDLDILVQPDYSYRVMDMEEFEEHAKRYGYSDEEMRSAHAAVAELISLIERRQFPFALFSVSSVVHV